MNQDLDGVVLIIHKKNSWLRLVDFSSHWAHTFQDAMDFDRT